MSTFQEQVTTDQSVEEVIGLLSHEDRSWLEPFLRIAAHAGEQAGFDLRARLRPIAVRPSAQTRVVSMELGDPTVVVENGSIEIPFVWTSAGYRCVSPRMEGRFIVARRNGEAATVAIDASFDPPRPVTGDLDDALVAHHAAQVSIKDLLGNLRTALNAESSETSAIHDAL